MWFSKIATRCLQRWWAPTALQELQAAKLHRASYHLHCGWYAIDLGAKKIQKAASSYWETQGFRQTLVWVKWKCTCRKQEASQKQSKGLRQSPVTGLSSGNSEFRNCCPVMVPPPPAQHNLLPKGTVIFMNALNCSQVITFRKFSFC